MASREPIELAASANAISPAVVTVAADVSKKLSLTAEFIIAAVTFSPVTQVLGAVQAMSGVLPSQIVNRFIGVPRSPPVPSFGYWANVNQTVHFVTFTGPHHFGYPFTVDADVDVIG